MFPVRAALVLVGIVVSLGLTSIGSVDAMVRPEPGHLIVDNQLRVEGMECNGNVTLVYQPRTVDGAYGMSYKLLPGCYVVPSWEQLEPRPDRNGVEKWRVEGVTQHDDSLSEQIVKVSVGDADFDFSCRDGNSPLRGWNATSYHPEVRFDSVRGEYGVWYEPPDDTTNWTECWGRYDFYWWVSPGEPWEDWWQFYQWHVRMDGDGQFECRTDDTYNDYHAWVFLCRQFPTSLAGAIGAGTSVWRTAPQASFLPVAPGTVADFQIE